MTLVEGRAVGRRPGWCRGSRPRRTGLGVVAALAVSVLSACTGVADVETPDPGRDLGARTTESLPPPDYDPTPEAAPGPELSVAEIGSRFGSSVYRVDASGCGYEMSGSGFVVDDRHVVTNRHVVASDPTPVLVSRDGTEIAGTVIGWEQSPDVAVIQVEDGGLAAPIPWAPASELTEGQELVSIGYPAPAGDFSVFGVSIVSFQSAESQRQAIRADGALDRGNSGGPALTRDGRVAGVVTEMAQNPGGLQLVPLIFTADALRSTVEGIIAAPTGVTEDCGGSARDVVPEDWDAGPQAGQTRDYGDDASLDALYDECEAGDFAACDSLYLDSPYGSEYEAFGSTCGGTRNPAYGICDQAENSEETTDLGVELESQCEDGDLGSCDALYWVNLSTGGDLTVAKSCGGAAGVDHRGTCRYSDVHGEGLDTAAEMDPAVLREECADGVMDACDDLYWTSDLDSEDEAFAETCGERTEVSVFGRCRLDGP